MTSSVAGGPLWFWVPVWPLMEQGPSGIPGAGVTSGGSGGFHLRCGLG